MCPCFEVCLGFVDIEVDLGLLNGFTTSPDNPPADYGTTPVTIGSS